MASKRQRADQEEQEIILRKFDGVNLLVDQAYLGPSYLRRATNWIPGDTYRLSKMPGNAAYAGGNIATASAILRLIRAYATTHRYLYAVIQTAGGTGDELWVSVDDGAWSHVQLAAGGNVVFTAVGGRYGHAEMNGVIYIGNGEDAILMVTIGSTATPMAPITAFTNGVAGVSKTSDPGAQWLTGTYNYAWAIFDHTASVWVERGQTQTFTVTQTGDQAISWATPTGFASNGGTLSSRFRAHLFVAPINLPIEFAHDQNPDGSSAGGTIVLRTLIATGPPLPLSGVARKGRIFRAHRGRLWIGGDPNATTAVWGSSLVVPGLEQAIFNAGVFWPYNARLPRIYEDVTAIGLVATGRDDPDSPVVVTGLTSTWLWFGDIIDDPGAGFIQVSKTIGCIGADAMAETPWGTFYVGLESVYMVPPGGGAPLDVGWPIRPAIIGIPATARSKVRVLYHKGFLKVAIVPAGNTQAVQQWWLDLRQGVSQIPSWWGPHKRAPVAQWTVGYQDDAETDLGIQASTSAIIERIHQFNSYVENGGGTTLVSILQTGDLDANRPFDRKTFTRVRVTAFPGATTQVQVGMSIDGATVGPFDTMQLPGPPGAQWNQAQWNIDSWGQDRVVSEGFSIAPTLRPRGRTASVQLTHSQAVALSIRDFELVFLPVDRPTRLLPNDPNS